MPSQIQNGFDNHADADPLAQNDKDNCELKIGFNAPTLF
jgi:hypothetical protein